MLVMMHAHARISGDGILLSQYVRSALFDVCSNNVFPAVRPSEALGRLSGSERFVPEEPVRILKSRVFQF